jgi:hypothetical protein
VNGLTRHPVDFESLEKGTSISREELEEILGVSSDDDKYPFAVMALSVSIERHAGIVCCQEKKTLRLLTDVEADAYTERRLRHHVDGLTRVVNRRLLIDRSSMGGMEQLAAESRDRIATATAIAAQTAMRQHDKIERARMKKIKD